MTTFAPTPPLTSPGREPPGGGGLSAAARFFRSLLSKSVCQQRMQPGEGGNALSRRALFGVAAGVAVAPRVACTQHEAAAGEIAWKPIVTRTDEIDLEPYLAKFREWVAREAYHWQAELDMAYYNASHHDSLLASVLQAEQLGEDQHGLKITEGIGDLPVNDVPPVFLRHKADLKQAADQGANAPDLSLQNGNSEGLPSPAGSAVRCSSVSACSHDQNHGGSRT